MWSVGISVSPCAEATRIGYDERQMNRIVIRMAQYFLDRNMRVIFGHDWREDGVMQAVANFAEVVAARDETDDEKLDGELPSGMLTEAELPVLSMYQMTGLVAASDRAAPAVKPLMLNVVPTNRVSLSRAAIEAQRNSGGVLGVLSLSDGIEQVREQMPEDVARALGLAGLGGRAAELRALRHCTTALLDPGCRICLGGKTTGYEGKEPDVMEEARLALEYRKPLFLMGGFGGATRAFGEKAECRMAYQNSENGLLGKEKQELFETTDIERAIRLISSGIERIDGESKVEGVGLEA